MTINFFNAELVEAYLSNQLSAELKARFEQNLKDDPKFSEFVSLYEDVDKAISEDDVMDLRNSLNSIHKEVSQEWVDEAPMKVEDTFEKDIFNAIGEEDVMNLRATLNEIHDLNQEELYSSDEMAEVESMDMKELLSLVGDEEDFIEDSELDKEIEMAIAEDDVMDLRNQLGVIAEEVKTESKPAKTVRMPLYKRMSKLSVAASLALILSLGATSFFILDDGMSPIKAAGRFYDTMEAQAPQRGGSLIEADAAKQEAINSYRDKDWLDALDKFKDVQLKYTDLRNDVDIALYIANCYLGIEKYDKAAEHFKVVYENNETTRQQEAEWYLAGCYLRDENTRGEALKIYKQIAKTPKHQFFDENEKLLKKLKK